jgi:hemerythrin-like domain-containing protein
MSEKQESNIAISFINIHKIITRGLMISHKSIQEILQRGVQQEGSLEGIFNYLRALTSVLNAHHLTEDELAFPYFRNLLPEAPFDSLTKWHREMDQILEEINLAIGKGEINNGLEKRLISIEDALGRLNEMWPLHIEIETHEFITKADALISLEEQLRLVRLFSEHGQKLSGPPFLTVPFMLFNLPVDDRQIFSQGMPAEILTNLVPVVWKKQWESMIPFLLV